MGDGGTQTAGGTTASERYLASLCERTFLRLWSYANVFRKQGQPGGKGDGKELCDLLVVFGDDVIIFSDKSCVMTDSGDVEVDWRRWYKRAIAKSADQVYGAERWLMQFPDRVFRDRPCTAPLPIALPPPERMRVHRVVVALNAGERCRKHFGGGSGSLIVEGSGTPRGAEPFAVRADDFPKGFVHVFDDVSLDAVMRELDTVADFLAYLTKKQSALMSGRVASAAGEEELLGFYLKDINDDDEHDFVGPPDATLLIGEGEWQHYVSSGARQRKVEADRQSYFWDGFIEHFTKHLLGGTLRNPLGSSLSDHERCVRFMAGENRVSRRLLSRAIGEKRAATGKHQRGVRLMLSPLDKSRAFIFLFVPPSSETMSYEEYRDFRVKFLQLHCQLAFLEVPELQTIVGIATEPPGWGGMSEELMLIHRSPLTAEETAELRATQRQLNILVGIGDRMLHTREAEYPSAAGGGARKKQPTRAEVARREKKAARQRQKAARKRSRR